MRSAGIITRLNTQTARVRDGTNDSPCVNLRAVEIEGFTGFSGRKRPRSSLPPSSQERSISVSGGSLARVYRGAQHTITNSAGNQSPA